MSSALKNVVCAISGGVDSCVAALILKNRGFQVQGVFMRNWDIADEKGFCQADHDKEDAEYVCRKLNIPFIEVNFVKEYWNNVFSYLLHEYKNGFTPNPDILCNKKIKFDAFFKYALRHLKADAIATGHYARIATSGKDGQSFKLLRGVDREKDQTFFLSQIPKVSLEKCMFPIGEMAKSEVKKMAVSAGFDRIVKKKEVCSTTLTARFVTVTSLQRIHCWTIGQRCALPGLPTPFYVAEKNVTNQDILVAPGRMHPALFHQTLVTEPPYWINNPPDTLSTNRTLRCEFRFQHREPLVNCLLFQDQEQRLQVYLEKPLRALTPGQYAVFYDGEECLGSARILFQGPSMYDLEAEQNKSFLVS
ncbi:hypothetical protein JTE90_018355 [Oedothorax gibbosus]|uniref:tRNA-5-taurinomethyluridine 2-sulfurtransferase n=1 Tax=Oedothorax gibbosus TaxID=931172 RepID=A0AAV6TZ16_9ARAC|nr:hypothetical protein JTE90_018355 [Oedothorax gibbosus]